MKKVLFLQIKGNSLGGIWFVDKAIGEELIKRGYKVSVFAYRNNHPGLDIKDTKIRIKTMRKKDAIKALISFKFSDLKKYFIEQKKLQEDYKKMQDLIIKEDPNYIIATHYQTLYGIPKNYLSKVIFVQHSSFDYLLADKKNVKVLKKFNEKIKLLCWLSKSTMQRAIDYGFKKNYYIYNPIKFNTNKVADVKNNKKIVVVTRIHKEKRIDLMIKIVNDVFKDKKYKDWTFDIYGVGDFNSESQAILKSSNQIFYKGVTDDVKNVLLNGSLTLNTSIFEGFSLSILEGYMCGLPIIAFDFSENAKEEIIDDYNGYVISKNDVEQFKNKLRYVLDNEDKLKELSKNAKEFSKQFVAKKIVDKWENVFNNFEVKK